MSDSSARTIAAAIVLASVVAAFAVVCVDRKNDERHYERMLFDCLPEKHELGRSLRDSAPNVYWPSACRALVREVAK